MKRAARKVHPAVFLRATILALALATGIALRAADAPGPAGTAPAPTAIVYDNCHDPVIDRGLATFPPTPPQRAHALWEPKNGRIFNGFIVPSSQPADEPGGYRQRLAEYARLTGVAPSLSRLEVYIGDDSGPYPGWSARPYAKSVDLIHDCGMVPIIAFYPMCKPHWNQTDITNAWKLADILGGGHDAWLTEMARSLKATGKPVMFIPLPAPNVWQWAWGIAGNWKPAGYIAAYKHIAGIFQAERADNVALCFGPEMTAGDHDWQSYRPFYPGDDEVDYVTPSTTNKIPAGAIDWILMHLPQKPVLYSSWTMQPALFRWYCPSGGPPTVAAYTHDLLEFSLHRWPANMTGEVFNGYSPAALAGTDTASRDLTAEYLAQIKDQRFLNGPLDWKNLPNVLYTDGGTIARRTSAH